MRSEGAERGWGSCQHSEDLGRQGLGAPGALQRQEHPHFILEGSGRCDASGWDGELRCWFHSRRRTCGYSARPAHACPG